jgi:signal transduction histidine kinase
MRLELASGLPLVRGDRIQLQQVIINLAVNAMQAMATVLDRERMLIVRTLRHGSGQVLVAVEDVGMGLSICRSIIEAHGGFVWASPNAGPGTTFQFTISA